VPVRSRRRSDAIKSRRKKMSENMNDKEGYEAYLAGPECNDRCPHCGGQWIGDGYTTPVHCENADCPQDREADANPLPCSPNPADYSDRGAWINAHRDPRERERLIAEWAEEQVSDTAPEQEYEP
jgi:hypothetical protein